MIWLPEHNNTKSDTTIAHGTATIKLALQVLQNYSLIITCNDYSEYKSDTK